MENTEQRPFLNPTWSQFDNDMEHIAKRLKRVPCEYEYIVAIPRGGLVVATILSHSLDVGHVLTVKQFKDILQNRDAVHSHILLVDDISDSGDTFKEYCKTLEQIGGPLLRITTVAWYIRKETTKFIPDFWAADAENYWIQFPWERKYE